MNRPETVGKLRESGYQVLPVKEEVRRNLIRMMERGEELFPGIIGFDDTVIPSIENALLAGQDIILLGERGQAKTRIIRSLTRFLDDVIPVVAGCEINDNPYAPICKRCRELIEAKGDDAPVAWLGRDQRYSEKLATPDVTIADLIGEVDPIKVAEGRYLSDELTIHYGLIARTNRGIFCINELPDLPERIQVGLFTLMEEREVQIRGFKVRMPLDTLLVASANPEDYTSRGRIITPLKDRYGAQVRTHYPRTAAEEIQIMEQERKSIGVPGITLRVPQYMKEIIAHITRGARRSPDVDQRSGVSVRMSIANYETMISNATRRAIRLHEPEAVPRVCDLPATLASARGKLELDTLEEGQEEALFTELTRNAVRTVFDAYVKVEALERFVAQMDGQAGIEVSDMAPAEEYLRIISEHDELGKPAMLLAEPATAGSQAAAVELILEGLYAHSKLSKELVGGKPVYAKV